MVGNGFFNDDVVKDERFGKTIQMSVRPLLGTFNQ